MLVNSNRTEADYDFGSIALSYRDFLASYGTGDSPNQPPTILMHAALNTFNYGKLETAILIYLDHLDGVKTSLEIDESKTTYPTGIGYIRDCTAAKKLEDRLSPDDPIIIGNNLLLRALGAARGIDHVLIHKYDTEHYDAYQNARIKLQLYMRELIFEINANSKDMDNEILNAIHRKFNLKLSALLHETNLNNDLETPQQHAKLIGHYRDLSSVLDPAKTVVTLRNENIEGIDITFRETSYPITVKTAEQKHQLEVMTNIKMSDSELDEEEINSDEEQEHFTSAAVTPAEPPLEEPVAGRNYHAVKPVAFQIADEAFVGLIQKDDRRLPAQTRYTVAPTVKNGYIVHNEIELKNSAQETIGKSENWSLRAATMAYIGAGETHARSVMYAKENIQQLMQAAKQYIPASVTKFNYAMLLTDTAWGKQDKMIKITRDAIKALAADQHAIQYSYLPTNILGTPQSISYSDFVLESAKKQSVTPPSTAGDLMDKKARIEKVGKVINILNNSGDVINITACASGQDRTGSAQEVASIFWEAQEIAKHLKQFHGEATHEPSASPLMSHIMYSRALGLNNAILGTLSTPGSTGMKTDSRPDNYFPEIINAYFYRKTAKTNKAPPIDKAQVEKLYLPNITKAELQQTYAASLKTINETSDPKIILTALTVWAETALRYQQLKEPKGLRDKISDTIAKSMRFGLFGNSDKEKARSMRNIATEMVAFLRDQKVLSKPVDIYQMITSLNKWRDDHNEKYPKNVKPGTVIRNLFELSHAAALQLGAQVAARPRSR